MRKIIAVFILLIVNFIFVTMAAADAKPTAEQGRGLFENSSLGTTTKSCSTCHPAGNGLDESAALSDKELEQTTNRCIEKALKGKPLASGSHDLSSLVLYLKSLGQAKGK
jgi:cytochrome c553